MAHLGGDGACMGTEDKPVDLGLEKEAVQYARLIKVTVNPSPVVKEEIYSRGQGGGAAVPLGRFERSEFCKPSLDGY